MEARTDWLTHGVYVVTAQHEGRRGGLAVAWACQTSPSHVLVCIGKQSATRDLILAADAFGLCALARDQLELARLFGGQSSRKVDKFAGLATHTGTTGAPLLDDCGLCLECRVEKVYDADEAHKLIVGRIVAAEERRAQYEPLLFRTQDY